MNQEDEPCTKIDINQTVGVIVLGTQYNLQGGYISETLLTGKRLRWLYWNPLNITEDVIERYNNFNTKSCPKELIFGEINNQTIPSIYSDFINYYDDDGNLIDSKLADNKGVEYAVVPNDKDTNDEITAIGSGLGTFQSVRQSNGFR